MAKVYGICSDNKCRCEVLGAENFIDFVYPIGSIYMSVNNINPATLFGGQWESWGQGKTIVGVNPSESEFSTSEKTGGEKTHKLTEEELPKLTGSATFGQGAKTTGSSLRSATGKFSASGSVNCPASLETNYNVSYNKLSMSIGGGASHNNLQPYITCYMWKRTA